MKTQISATKVFSQVSSSPKWLDSLKKSSNSEASAKHRLGIYNKVFSQFDEMNDALRTFSGATEMPLLSNQYFNATMASYVRSFAGFATIERDMPQPTALLWFMDLIGVLNNRKVLPNIGPDDLSGIGARVTDSGTLTGSAVAYTAGEKIIPGSISLKLIHAATPTAPVIIKDDLNGNLIGAANVLAVGTVNYSTGAINFQVGTGFVPAAGDKYYLSASSDVPGTPEFGGAVPGSGYGNRFKLDMNSIQVTSEPDMLIAENNIMSIAAMQKAVGVNPSDVAGAKLVELYTKLINLKITNSIVDADQSTVHAIDSNAWTSDFYDYQSRLDAFKAELISVDTKLATQSVKGVAATTYIVGSDLGNWFRRLTQDNLFVDNQDSTYISDLLGYYKGIPVLRHDSLGAKDGYAIHKTKDGQLAPSIRGIFLPLTDTPAVGNYNNPSQLATGVYYQEATESIVPELVQKFSVNSI